MTVATHPDPATLAAFGLGRLPADDRAAVEAHVAECSECCRALGGVSADSLVELARTAMATFPIAGQDTLPSDVPPALVDHPRYKVLNRIGVGGMGAVYKAEHRLMGRTVALKVVAPGLVSDPAALDRFRREVRLASRLAHPNIVTAHDADEAGGQHFLVMEYVEGVSLYRLVAKKGPLPVATACQLARQVALGLQHAADKGMVHRDIKPHNLMVTRKGQVKILDFGLARVAASADAPPASTWAGGVTAPNMVLGTPDFLAPEQARNAAAADTRADLYALGCTLYYLLTGRPPFTGDTALAKLIAHVEDQPTPLSASRTDIPAGLAEVLAKLMAKDPATRYQTPTEAAAALLPFTKPGGAEPAPVEAVLVLPATDDEERIPPAVVVAKPPGVRRMKRRPAPRGWTRRRVLQAAGGGLALVVFLVGGVIIAGKVKSRPAGAAGAVPPPVATSAGGFRVVMLLPSDKFWNPDYEPVRRVLEAQGCGVSVASTTKVARPDPGGGGRDVPIDLSVDQLRPEDWDAVVLCGGEGVKEYLLHNAAGPRVADFLRRMAKADRVVAAICMAPGVLLDAGVLDNRGVTGHAIVRDKAMKKAVWHDTAVVVDGPVVTGRDPKAAGPFAEQVVGELRKRTRR